MKLTVRYAGLTDPGRVRQTNEDNWIANPDQGLFIVADGMGGQFAGMLASRAVVETLPGLIRQHFEKLEGLPKGRAERRMAKAVATLSSQIRQQTQNEPGLEGMGSTVVCALVRGSQVLIAHMGDSRAYRLRVGRLKQLTKDHSLVELLISSGDITPEEAATHPARGRLTRNVGMEGEPLPQTRLLKLKASDLILLCTDGLSGMLSAERILEILKEPQPLEVRCQSLMDAANQAGGTDNITAVLLKFVGEEKGQSLAESTRFSGSSV